MAKSSRVLVEGVRLGDGVAWRGTYLVGVCFLVGGESLLLVCVCFGVVVDVLLHRRYFLHLVSCHGMHLTCSILGNWEESVLHHHRRSKSR